MSENTSSTNVDSGKNDKDLKAGPYIVITCCCEDVRQVPGQGVVIAIGDGESVSFSERQIMIGLDSQDMVLAVSVDSLPRDEYEKFKKKLMDKSKLDEEKKKKEQEGKEEEEQEQEEKE